MSEALTGGVCLLPKRAMSGESTVSWARCVGTPAFPSVGWGLPFSAALKALGLAPTGSRASPAGLLSVSGHFEPPGLADKANSL